MTAIEPRLAKRRKGVREDRARGRLKWVLVILFVVLTVVGGVWLIRSPILSIRSVTITGASASDPAASVAMLGMGQGTPTIDVDAGAIEAAIEADPWVRDATVDVSWPGTVAIAVAEHTPFATVRAADGWVRVASDGSVLMSGPPLDGAPLISIDAGPVTAGYSLTNPLIVGALEFSAALPADLAAQIELATDGEGLAATLLGHSIILGRPSEMADKAAVLVALLESGIEPDAVINLIAPSRPAITNPQPLLEVEE
ncbi:MAG: FtsQ-type POTRA domain-containing protein [Acidimicrobiia bacterium]